LNFWILDDEYQRIWKEMTMTLYEALLKPLAEGTKKKSILDYSALRA
jgi:hypothetical protein